MVQNMDAYIQKMDFILAQNGSREIRIGLELIIQLWYVFIIY